MAIARITPVFFATCFVVGSILLCWHVERQLPSGPSLHRHRLRAMIGWNCGVVALEVVVMIVLILVPYR